MEGKYYNIELVGNNLFGMAIVDKASNFKGYFNTRNGSFRYLIGCFEKPTFGQGPDILELVELNDEYIEKNNYHVAPRKYILKYVEDTECYEGKCYSMGLVSFNSTGEYDEEIALKLTDPFDIIDGIALWCRETSLTNQALIINHTRKEITEEATLNKMVDDDNFMSKLEPPQENDDDIESQDGFNSREDYEDFLNFMDKEREDRSDETPEERLYRGFFGDKEIEIGDLEENHDCLQEHDSFFQRKKVMS